MNGVGGECVGSGWWSAAWVLCLPARSKTRGRGCVSEYVYGLGVVNVDCVRDRLRHIR